MPLSFPKTTGKVFDFSHGEIDLGGKIFTGFENISYNQPIEEGVLYGAAAEPLGRTRGQLQIGEGELQWSSIEEAVAFLETLGDGFLEKEFTASVTLNATGSSPIKDVLYACRLLNVESDFASGTDPLGLTMPFSFLHMTRNGKKALLNQRT